MFIKNIFFKSILFSWLFSQFFMVALAQDPTILLSANKTELDINENLALTLQISANQNISIGEIAIDGIQDNFDKIGQSTTSSMKNINGKTTVIYNLTLNLKAKEKGEYTLGPAFFQYENNKISSNSIKIKITGNKMFLNNVSGQFMNQLNQKTGNKPVTLEKENINEEELKNETTDKTSNLDKNKKNKYQQFLLLIIVSIFTFSIFYLFANKKNNSFPKTFPSKPSTKSTSSSLSLLSPTFKIKKIILPNLDDSDFLLKIDTAFRSILSNNLEQDLTQKTYQEILKNITQKTTKEEELNLIKEIIWTLTKLRYNQKMKNENNCKQLLENIQKLQN